MRALDVRTSGCKTPGCKNPWWQETLDVKIPDCQHPLGCKTPRCKTPGCKNPWLYDPGRRPLDARTAGVKTRDCKAPGCKIIAMISSPSFLRK